MSESQTSDSDGGQIYDLAIIGGGPAGASAATFAARAGLRTLVLDSDKGMTRRAMLWNHLGFPDGITGPDLVDHGHLQAIRAGAEWRQTEVTALEPQSPGFVLRTSDSTPVHAHTVLLTTGANVALAQAANVATRTATEPRIKDVIVVDPDGRTSVPGIWAAGTAAGLSVHTIVTAGDGARVAINVISERKGQRHVDHDVLQAAAAPTAAAAPSAPST